MVFKVGPGVPRGPSRVPQQNEEEFKFTADEITGNCYLIFKKYDYFKIAVPPRTKFGVLGFYDEGECA